MCIYMWIRVNVHVGVAYPANRPVYRTTFWVATLFLATMAFESRISSTKPNVAPVRVPHCEGRATHGK
jgi:hypothetical protein